MSSPLRASAVVVLAALLTACAAETAPDPATAPEGTASTSEAMCGTPLVVSATGTLPTAPLASATVSFTTSSGYTSLNCSGRAVIIAYGDIPAHPHHDSVKVLAVPGEVANMTAADCTGAYVDFSVGGPDAATGIWKTIGGFRQYGQWSGGACYLGIAGGWDSTYVNEYELTAVAYRPVVLPFGAHFLSPVDITLSISRYDYK